MSETPQSPAGPYGLTDRESEAWKWIAEGKSNWEIGRIMGCSKETVKKHVQRICGKLDVSNRAAAAAIYGRECGSVNAAPHTASAPDRPPFADIWP
jgi:DNA-binding CsgD family transcriptional regulator